MTSETKDFGANEWFVQDMYQQFLNDPSSVDPAWHEFFADYRPGDATSAPVATPPPTVTPLAAPPAPAPAAAAPAAPAVSQPAPAADASTAAIKGVAATVAKNMAASLSVPTATSVRAFPAKLLEDNRIVINRHLARARGGKVSFTHLIGFALVQAAKSVPVMNNSYSEVDGKPVVVTPSHVGLGLAIDLEKPDGSRQLVVAAIRGADQMDFYTFWQAYEDIVRRARTGKLTADDFAGVTISLTNPGGIGTVHSVPRLMQGQGAIIGVGAMEYPAEYQGSSQETLAKLAVSKTITLTSTYDHRIIQGAQSGEFLRAMHQLLLGQNGFYESVFTSLHIPYVPVQWVADKDASHEGDLDKTTRVHELIHAYRVRGHLMADTDPLEFKIRSHPDLDVVNHGLTLWDLDREFPVAGFSGQKVMKLRDILGVLRDSYCRTVGLEYMHIQDPEQRRWLQERVEKKAERPDPAMQLHVLERLNAAEAFEAFLQTKFVGQKRFSLEGAESVIPLLDEILASASRVGLDEVCIGMPHRGRLNVLANIIGKSYGQIFREFDGTVDPASVQGSGDVKYHLGAEGSYSADGGKEIATYLACNPSHLEAVDPVLEGIVRAKQDMIDKGERGFTVLPVLLHGDAAFAGQGVVAETLNLSQLKGYRTGGTVHVVVNNQVGFTTAPQFSRSSVYCTDIARMVQAPIFHVNGDDPEACVRVARLAFEYRQAFKSDVVIDMVCYRRRGHNEGDEPTYTQPLMYDTIDAKRSTRKLYTEALIGRGDITIEQAEEALKSYQTTLERAFTETREATSNPSAPADPAPAPALPVELDSVDTAISLETLKAIADSQVSAPEGFTVHPKLIPQMEKRVAMASQGGIDWAFGETIAFGSLLLEGRTVRLAGQDSRRGTFSQRHASLVDRVNGSDYLPLNHLSDDQARFFVYDSLLSEYAALGFEYGYAVARPESLVLWEAQFGDFVNGAQSITDEFISSGEQKWGQRSSVVMLLPHGYEGQGPDHSSARVERFLQMCAENNMTVSAPSTPGNYMHLLRAHTLSPTKRPLVVFTPKSMLRNPAARSSVEDVTTGRFQPVIPDPKVTSARRVILSSGKIYWDLLAAREKQAITDIALVRVEQLYPIPDSALKAALESHADAELVWVQEEPANQGAWMHMREHLTSEIIGNRELKRVSRKASASPSAGSHKVHEIEQIDLVAAALA